MTLENARGESRKVFWTMLLAACAGVASAGADGSLADFPRLAGETDDAGRLQRAIDATPSGVLRVPGGEYAVASPVLVTNRCSLALEKSAKLRIRSTSALKARGPSCATAMRTQVSSAMRSRARIRGFWAVPISAIRNSGLTA